MKAIKCPNCGNKMKAMSAPCKVTILAVDAQWRCPSCNVCGPSARAKNAYLAIRDAARLTREWIARMDATRCNEASKCASRDVPAHVLISRWVESEMNPEVTP